MVCAMMFANVLAGEEELLHQYMAAICQSVVVEPVDSLTESVGNVSNLQSRFPKI